MTYVIQNPNQFFVLKGFDAWTHDTEEIAILKSGRYRWFVNSLQVRNIMKRLNIPRIDYFRHLQREETLLVVDWDSLSGVAEFIEAFPFVLTWKFSGRRGFHGYARTKQTFEIRRLKRAMLGWCYEHSFNYKDSKPDVKIYSPNHLIRGINAFHDKSKLFSIIVDYIDDFNPKEATRPKDVKTHSIVNSSLLKGWIREWETKAPKSDFVVGEERPHTIEIEDILFRPCVHNALMGVKPSHEELFMICLFLRDTLFGVDVKGIVDFLERNNGWTELGFSRKEATRQVEHIIFKESSRKKKYDKQWEGYKGKKKIIRRYGITYDIPTCKTIRDIWGFCPVPEGCGVIDPSEQAIKR
jgi:hypothetical protein